MAKLIPSVDKIKLFKRKPTEAEVFILNKLSKLLDDTHEIFYRPFYNGDRPTIIIVKKNYYIYILEVCDININEYDFIDNQFISKADRKITYAPFDKVTTYKNNIYDLHLYSFDIAKKENSKAYGIVYCGVYFHNINQIDMYHININISDENISDYIARLYVNNFGEHFNALRHKSRNKYFIDSLYKDISRLLNPPEHIAELGIDIGYGEKQREIINYNKRNELVVKGGMGTGKTSVLAKCAVQEHKKTNDCVLILTYNIALRNLIHEKINNIKEHFMWDNFHITHYHEFIKIELNNLGIRIKTSSQDLSNQDVEDELDKNYYSNELLFKIHEHKINKYAAIFIDEIQDYKKSWLNIIKKYFLKPNGKFILFGDINQNIYNRDTINNRTFETNVIGRPIVLNECYRSASKIVILANLFKKEIYHENNTEDILVSSAKNKRDTIASYSLGNIETIISNEHIEEISMLKVDIPVIYNKIRTYIKNQSYHPNDIAVISNKLKIIRELEFYYQYSCREETNVSFERFEECIHDSTYRTIFDRFPHHFFDDTFKEDITSMKHIILLCFLQKKYNTFNIQLQDYCSNNNIDYYELLSFIDEHNDIFLDIEHDELLVENTNLRRDRKLNFIVNKGTMKFSTIHTFKGWESKCVFLLLDTRDINNFEKANIFELIYTGLTRAKHDLLVFNIGNDETNIKLSELIHDFNQLGN